LDPEYTRASFGYFFTDGSVDVKLGDDIVDKLRGKSRRRPLSTTDILILKIMFQGGDDSAALSPRSSQNNHPDLVFWLVLHQRRATAPFHNYKLIRELERQVNLCKAENNELRHYMHQMHSEMLQMRMDMRLLRENACAPPYTSAYTTFGGATSPMPPPNNASTWLPWKNPRYAFNPDSAQPPSSQLVVSTIPASVQLNNSTQKSPSASQNHSPRTSSTAYRTTLSHVVLTALNQFETAVLAVSSSMNGQIPYSQKVSLVISLARGLLNCDVDFDLVVQFKESLLEHIESSETIDAAKSVVLSHLMDLLNPSKAVNMSASFNSSMEHEMQHLDSHVPPSPSALTAHIPHLERIYKPPVYDHDEHPHIAKRPLILMLVGMPNAGKTTVALQLAHYYISRGIKCAILETDSSSLPFLKIQVEEHMSVPFYGSDTNQSSLDVTRDGMRCLLDGSYSVIIVDTPSYDNPHNVFSNAATTMHTVAEVSKELIHEQISTDEITEEAHDSSIDGEQSNSTNETGPIADKQDTAHTTLQNHERPGETAKIQNDNVSDSSSEKNVKPSNFLPNGAHSVDEVLVVVDASIGNEAGLQISSFKNALGMRSCIVTKIHHPFAIGALSSIASTGTGISFISTSDKNEHIERYDVNHTLTELLDVHQGGSSRDSTVQVQNSSHESHGVFTLRDMMKQLSLVSATPRIQTFLKILENLSDDILDRSTQEEPDATTLSAIAQVAYVNVEDVQLLFQQYLSFSSELARKEKD